jgi:hypothetical protein
MKNILIALGIAFSLITGSVALAQNAGSPSFPIAELGNCKDKDACRVFCEKKENMTTCIAYGSKQGTMTKEEAVLATKAVEKIQAGQTPGGCTDRASCSTFCQGTVSNLKSCISFAKEMGAPQADIAEAERVSAALEGGAKLPGDCQGKQSCEAYCKNANHIDECLSFAEAAGMIPADQLAEAKKVAKFIKSGEMPGGCTDKAACENYCKVDAHFTECIDFADKAGLIPKEDLDMARKTGGKGPGDCKSGTECAAYCDNADHATECANFAVEKGLVSTEDAAKIKDGSSQIKQALDSIPAEARGQVESCLNTIFGGKLSAVLDGSQAITKTQGDKIQSCFADIGKIMQEKAMQGAMQGAAQGAGGAGMGASGQGQPTMNSSEIEKAMQGAPADLKVRIQQQADEARQREMEAAQKQGAAGMPTGGPVAAPTGAGVSPAQPPAGTQGAPCNSPEECRAMFGGSAGGPPAGIPAGY